MVFRIEIKKGLGHSQLLRGLKAVQKEFKVGLVGCEVLKMDDKTEKEKAVNEEVTERSYEEHKSRLLALYEQVGQSEVVPTDKLDKLVSISR